jgi:hypothetical protein
MKMKMNDAVSVPVSMEVRAELVLDEPLDLP